jgi:hypothetical protein
MQLRRTPKYVYGTNVKLTHVDVVVINGGDTRAKLSSCITFDPPVSRLIVTTVSEVEKKTKMELTLQKAAHIN